MIRLAIGRPVAVTMTYLALALLGVAAWRNIPLELLPSTSLPQLTVEAHWPGSSPEAVEAFVTSPLEAMIQRIAGVANVTSTSQPGMATIQVRFERGTDMDFTRLELSERLASLRDDLPARSSPAILPYVPREFREQQRPFLQYTVTGPYTTEALRAHVLDVLKPELARVPGVSDVEVHGGRDRLLEIALEPRRAEALGLSVQWVEQRIRDLEYVREAGLVEAGGTLRTVAIRYRSDSVDDLLDLPILTDRGRVVRLRDVAAVHDTFEDARQLYRVDGLPAVSFTVHKEVGTNVVALADAVKAHLDDLDVLHPPHTRIILDEDESDAVRTQLSDLLTRALGAAAVIFLVLLLFLRSVWSAAIVLVTIAFSVLITVNLIHLGGLTLNVLTLMGIAMGFGLIVDNAIVVLENIHRRRQAGDAPETAAERGARGVVLPVLAATMTTVVVLVPFVYLQGELQIYYVPLAVVVGFSLVASLFVAFSFIPGVASRVLGGVAPEDGVAQEAAASWYLRPHAAVLGFTLRHPAVTIVFVTVMLGGSYRVFDQHVTRGVVWGSWWGQDSYIEIQVRTQRGEELERVDALTRHFEERLKRTPEVDRFVTNVYPTFSRTRVTFPDSLESTGIPAAVKDQLVAYSHGFGGMDIRVYGYGPSFYAGGSSSPNYTIQVFGYGYETVREIADDLGDRLTSFSRIREVDTNSGGRFARGPDTELVLALDRERLALHGLSARDVVWQITAATRSFAHTPPVRIDGEEVRLAVKLEGSRRLDLLQLQDVMLRTTTGSGVRLGDVVRLDERAVPARIERENQKYRRYVAYEFMGPTRLGDAVRRSVIENTFLPPGYSIESGTDWRWDDHEKRQVYRVLILSIVLVFMVTAALFESVRQPLTVLLTVPMALIGVFVIFSHTGASFTREAYIGVVVMGGIVVNNAILLVDHINHLRRAEGMALEPATRRGTLERARPILMTSVTTIMGLLPLVLPGDGANDRIWNALTYALIGGLASSTLLVLTVTPALYLVLERAPERRRRVRWRSPETAAGALSRVR